MAVQLPEPAQTNTDVVGVFDQNFNQVFKDARPIKVVVKPLSKAMQQPLENGATVIDHRIILPLEIELSLVVQADNVQDVYRSIFQYWTNATILNIHTRSGVYQNQFITEMPHEESPDQIDTLIIAVKFAQAKFANTQVSNIPIQPSKPANSSTVDRGNLQPKTVKKDSSLDEVAQAVARRF